MNETVRRRLLGGGALVLLTVGAVLWVCSQEDTNRALGGMALRAGLLLGAGWLAFPQIRTLTSAGPPRLTWAILAGAVVLVFRPRAFPIVAALIAVMAVVEGVTWLFRPLPTGAVKPGTRSKRSEKRAP